MIQTTIDINSDLGESFGAYRIGCDSQVLSCVSSANIACGFHASDPMTMQKTVRLALENGAAIGAHPGFPDLVGFGRRNLAVSPAELKTMVIYQIGAINAFCRAEGAVLHHVKAHGAMYNMAARDPLLARALAEAVCLAGQDLILYGLSGSEMQKAAEEISLPFASEVFADRAYEDDGSLVSRSRPDAMITDEEEAVSRMLRLVRTGKITAVTGKEISLRADTICVHGDSEKALVFAGSLRGAFTREGIRISAYSG